jgi:hypothetical protein
MTGVFPASSLQSLDRIWLLPLRGLTRLTILDFGFASFCQFPELGFCECILHFTVAIPFLISLVELLYFCPSYIRLRETCDHVILNF